MHFEGILRPVHTQEVSKKLSNATLSFQPVWLVSPEVKRKASRFAAPRQVPAELPICTEYRYSVPVWRGGGGGLSSGGRGEANWYSTSRRPVLSD